MPANRQTVPRAEREASIVAAAQAEFLELGFEAATVGSIARRAGMTSPNVHYYFATKDALFGATLRKAYGELFDSLEAVDDPVERLRRYVAFHLRNHPLRSAVQALAAQSPEVAGVLAWRDDWVAETVAAVTPDALDGAALTAVVTGLIEVAVPRSDADDVLRHAVARLARPRRSRR